MDAVTGLAKLGIEIAINFSPRKMKSAGDDAAHQAADLLLNKRQYIEVTEQRNFAQKQLLLVGRSEYIESTGGASWKRVILKGDIKCFFESRTYYTRSRRLLSSVKAASTKGMAEKLCQTLSGETQEPGAIVGKAAPQIISIRNKILPAGTDRIVLPIDLPDRDCDYAMVADIKLVPLSHIGSEMESLLANADSIEISGSIGLSTEDGDETSSLSIDLTYEITTSEPPSSDDSFDASESVSIDVGFEL